MKAIYRMTIFLQAVAAYIYDNYKTTTSDLCVVFPNRRAGLFFNRYYSKLIDKPVWAPPIKTIADLMRDLSGLQLADSLTLTFNLYKIYHREKVTQETFDAFYYWGEMLLNDFDDIDKNLVDAAQLFQNLADIKEIDNQFSLPEEQLQIIREFWTNISIKESSPLKNDFMTIWENLFRIYTDFKESLRLQKIGYEGMMCRDVIDQIAENGNLKTKNQKYIFVGFNALNECEKSLFRYLKGEGKAEFFWDYDDYYIDNTWHEAGRFIRENRIQFPQPPGNFSHSSLTKPKNISIISVPSDVGQAKMIASLLESTGGVQGKINETAIILADEQLLIPVLSSLPESINEVNVTLGYPLKLTPVYSFSDSVLNMQRNIRKSAGGEIRFFHQDVKVLLNHPYTQSICPDEAAAILQYIIQNNRVFVTAEELNTHEFIREIFRFCTTSYEFLEYILNLGAKVARILPVDDNQSAKSGFDREYWFTFLTALNRLADIIRKEMITMEMPTLIRILRKLTGNLSIPFRGEPLAGLQVMGMLETRVIDFTNIILLSANEGMLPKSEAALSFIPYNLRRGFGLPTIEHQDAIFAYYFYRLIQRAERVTLLYNSSGGNRSGEMSRFLYQLKYEKAFQVSEKSMNFRVTLSNEEDITIVKDERVMKELYQYTVESGKQYLTPTALTSYLECTLRFYFRYIAHIKKQDTITEDIEGSMFGRLLHTSMELLYSPYLGQTLEIKDFEKLLASENTIEQCVLKAFAVEFFKKENDRPDLHGKSIVVKEVLIKYIRRILEVDKKFAPITLMEFEKSFQTGIAVPTPGVSINVSIGGKIDRVDKTDHHFRVIDYKTGKVDHGFNSIEQLFEINGKKQNKEVMQILLYAYVLGSDLSYKVLPVLPGIYGLRDIFKHDFDERIHRFKNELIENFTQVENEYVVGLQELLAGMFNPELPFTKVTDKKKCEYCDYKGICHR